MPWGNALEGLLSASYGMEEQPGAPLITVLENITTAHRPTLERQRIRLELDVPAGLRVPHAREVEHILDTLIDNAVRFSQEGDVVRVSTSVEGETVRIAVSDTGPGLSREQVDRFFRGDSQPFPPLETGGRPRLGLYLASEQARWLDGALTYEPNLPKGARFVLFLTRRSDLRREEATISKAYA